MLLNAEDRTYAIQYAWRRIDAVMVDLGDQVPWDAHHTTYRADLDQWWDWPLGEQRPRAGLWSLQGENITGTSEAIVRAVALRDATIMCDHHWRTWQTRPYQTPTTAKRGPWDWGALPPYRDLGWAWRPTQKGDPDVYSVNSRLCSYVKSKDYIFGAKRVVTLDGPLARWLPQPDMFGPAGTNRRSQHIRELLDLWTILQHLPVSDAAREVLHRLATPEVGGMTRLVRHELNPGLAAWLQVHGLVTIQSESFRTTRGVRAVDHFELGPRGRLLCYIKRSFHAALESVRKNEKET